MVSITIGNVGLIFMTVILGGAGGCVNGEGLHRGLTSNWAVVHIIVNGSSNQHNSNLLSLDAPFLQGKLYQRGSLLVSAGQD
jgi:hypothetical protein